ncbi:MAG: hypothetical protein Q7S50_03180 [bacterium]|nr:hypothetical protein [bacterium]
MGAFNAMLLAFGPMFLLGLAMPFGLFLFRGLVPSSSSRRRIPMFLIATFPLLLYSYRESAWLTDQYASFSPTFTGAVFFLIGTLIGMEVRRIWLP